MKAKSVKSQVTIFLILGIIMVVIFAILILVSNYSVKEATAPESIIAKKIPLELQPIKKFVDDCLSVVSKQGLKLLGKQGGYLFEDQGGTFPKHPDDYEGFTFVIHDGSSVFYNIIEQDFSTSKSVPAIPDYPWKSFPYEDGSLGNEQFEAPSGFGQNKIIPLNSMKSQFESYIKKPYDSDNKIKNNIDRCLNDFSVFEEQGFEISGEVRNVIVDINENDVVFKMEYPLIVENLGSGEITEIKDFLVKHEVRFGKLHAFVNRIIEKDIGDIRIDISDEDEENFKVFLEKRNVYENDDLIKVTDDGSLIDGAPYEYFFARKNRKPALEYLNPDKINLRVAKIVEHIPRSLTGATRVVEQPTKLTITFDGTLKKLEISMENNNGKPTEEYILNALDPDEDQITFHIFPYPIPLEFKCGESPFEVRVEVRDGGGLIDFQEIYLILDGCYS